MTGIDITDIVRLRELATRLDWYCLRIGKRKVSGTLTELLAQHVRDEADQLDESWNWKGSKGGVKELRGMTKAT
jgi:hypothetical protein